MRFNLNNSFGRQSVVFKIYNGGPNFRSNFENQYFYEYANLHIKFVYLLNWNILKIVESSEFSKSEKFIEIGLSPEEIIKYW